MRSKQRGSRRALNNQNISINLSSSGGSQSSANSATARVGTNVSAGNVSTSMSHAMGSSDTVGHDAQSSARPQATGMRYNAFKDKGTPTPVIYQSSVPNNSIGWSEQQFFNHVGVPSEQDLEEALNAADGSPEKIKQILNEFIMRQRAAQEYLLQGMPKGAMFQALMIAMHNGRFIAVRPTGVAAHPGIESGSPTKAQEFKNKTSKEMDIWLCNEIGFNDLGAVVHYDPRVGWSSSDADWEPFPKKPDEPKDTSDLAAMQQYEQDLAAWNKAVEDAWLEKRAYIENVRKNQLAGDLDKHRVKFPESDAEWAALRKWFVSRLTEYSEEDPEYRPGGHYAEQVHLSGPFIHLAARPDDHMYGDHDLFGFGMMNGDGTGTFVLDTDTAGQDMQSILQAATTFQAQHGGIWNWQTDTAFNQNIKNVIMGAHSPPNGEPLIVMTPSGTVEPMFYIAPDRLESAWKHPEATKWLESCYSGTPLLAAMKSS